MEKAGFRMRFREAFERDFPALVDFLVSPLAQGSIVGPSFTPEPITWPSHPLALTPVHTCSPRERQA